MLSVLPMAHNLEEGTVISQYFNAILTRKTRREASELEAAKQTSENKPAAINQIDYSNQVEGARIDDVSVVDKAAAVDANVGSKIDVTF